MNLKDYKLWVLDYDGCLLNSMPYWKRAGTEYIQSKGLKVKEGLDDRITVFTEEPSVRVLREEYNLPGALEDTLKDVADFVDTFYPYIPLKEGAEELLQRLKEMSVLLVVVSGSSEHIITLNMKHHTILPLFDGVYSVYHKEDTKENGRIFDFLEKEFHVSKKDMILLDDSLSNVTGGLRCGLGVLAVKDAVNEKYREDFRTLGIPCLSLTEITELLK